MVFNYRFFFGNLFFNNHFENNVYEKKNKYLYSFKTDLKIKNYNYGYKNYQLCTNYLGAIDDCNKKNINLKNIDYVFIGDSFVEGLGIQFKNTFFGLLKEKYPNKNFLNLGVSGYSTSIYYKKLKSFYDEGYKFSEIFVFLDTSDIFDEIFRYEENNNGQISFLLTNDQVNDLLNNKTKLIKKIHSNFPGSFFLISSIIKMMPNFVFLENYYLDLMVNHTFGEWVNGESSIYSKKDIDFSLKKNTKFVEKIVTIANDNNSKITFVLYPWPGQLYKREIMNKYNEFWSNFLDENNVNYINLNSIFFELLKKYSSKKVILEYYIPGDVHFNDLGHKLIF